MFKAAVSSMVSVSAAGTPWHTLPSHCSPPSPPAATRSQPLPCRAPSELPSFPGVLRSVKGPHGPLWKHHRRLRVQTGPCMACTPGWFPPFPSTFERNDAEGNRYWGKPLQPAVAMVAMMAM